MINIFYTDEEIKKIQSADLKKTELKNFMRLTDDWKLCEVIGFVNYRKIIKQYLGVK